jgi:hypothetical protein
MEASSLSRRFGYHDQLLQAKRQGRSGTAPDAQLPVATSPAPAGASAGATTPRGGGSSTPRSRPGSAPPTTASSAPPGTAPSTAAVAGLYKLKSSQSTHSLKGACFQPLNL